ncbi:MAG TPA: ornithine carbamoyltransferase, partial [Candidatus Hydrogenedentes bacterium]|nr:ornithine carbamoyltransferase [Candidatus Hydrogenedentota bacterium]
MTMPKDFISFLDFTQADLVALLDLADSLRDAWLAKQLPQNLAGKSVALIWDAEGFRNRVAFELDIAAMGGIAVQVPGRLDERESIEDVARYLDNWFDGVVSRARKHE